MKGSSLNPLDIDAETSILAELLDKFGASFSLEQIANAYCQAGRDANLTGAMLYELSNSTCVQPPNKLPKSEESSEVSHSDISEESPHGVLESSKSGYYHVSRVLGKNYVSPFSKESKYFHVIELFLLLKVRVKNLILILQRILERTTLSRNFYLRCLGRAFS